jgi:hypothetical protein
MISRRCGNTFAAGPRRCVNPPHDTIEGRFNDASRTV